MSTETLDGQRYCVGDRKRDGTVLAGISPDTHNLMYAMPSDAPLSCMFRDAQRYVRKLNAEKYLGHDDWRIPSKSEMKVLFNNHAAIGGFKTEWREDCHYWSSDLSDGVNVWAQCFYDGEQYVCDETARFSLRCVRG